MNDQANVRQKLAHLVYQVLDERISPDEAIIAANAIVNETGSKDESVIHAIHALHHYRDDCDIRKKDISYAKLQINGLKAIAEKLAEGLPLSKDENYYWLMAE